MSDYIHSLTQRVLTIDIETLPSTHPCLPSGKALNKDKADEEHAKTALSGDFGRILCIGYADDTKCGLTRRGVIGWDESTGTLHGDEQRILREFWDLLRDFRPRVDRVVGHNLFDFDLRFIYKRSVVHGVKPTVELSFARYRNQPLFDTMCEWERWGYGAKISLDRLARVLDLPTSKEDGIDGSKIWELFQSKQYRVIYEYCLKDVVLTRLIYRRMTFIDSGFLNNSRPSAAATIYAAV